MKSPEGNNPGEIIWYMYTRYMHYNESVIVLVPQSHDLNRLFLVTKLTIYGKEVTKLK